MRVPVEKTDAEKLLQVELDNARLEYVDRMAEVQATYFAQLELLHNKLARSQAESIERYHQEARGELTRILDGLNVTLIDAPSTSKVQPVYGTRTYGEALEDAKVKAESSSSFFAPEPDYIPELEAVVGQRNPFRRRKVDVRVTPPDPYADVKLRGRKQPPRHSS